MIGKPYAGELQVRFDVVMAVYLARSCPMCRSYFGIVIGEPKSENNVQPISGCCAKCGYEVNWTLLPGYGSISRR